MVHIHIGTNFYRLLCNKLGIFTLQETPVGTQFCLRSLLKRNNNQNMTTTNFKTLT